MNKGEFSLLKVKKFVTMSIYNETKDSLFLNSYCFFMEKVVWSFYSSAIQIPTRILCATLVMLLFGAFAHAHDEPGDNPKSLEHVSGALSGPFPDYLNVDAVVQLPLSSIGGGIGNDIWGWTDPMTSREYAIMGRSNGTSFVDVTNWQTPVYLGNLPSAAGDSAWRDMKVYSNHAYIVADNTGAHGMQVFDLTNLRGVVSPQTFAATASYNAFTEAHNIAINEDTGFAYVVGADINNRGLHFIDLSNPAVPVGAGGFAADGYTHDVQVVIYNGPDVTHSSKEIAFASNEDTLTIVDVTTKGAPTQVSRTGYTGDQYTHQGWLTEDHKYWIFNDELDERNTSATFTRTHVFDVQDLDNPSYIGFYQHDVVSIDHNLYIHEGLIYEANYTTGMRVLRPVDLSTASFELVAYLDTHPPKNTDIDFDGAWGIYPFFDSGTLIISDRNAGLIVTQLTLPEPGLLAPLAMLVSVFLGLYRKQEVFREIE